MCVFQWVFQRGFQNQNARKEMAKLGARASRSNEMVEIAAVSRCVQNALSTEDVITASRPVFFGSQTYLIQTICAFPCCDQIVRRRRGRQTCPSVEVYSDTGHFSDGYRAPRALSKKAVFVAALPISTAAGHVCAQDRALSLVCVRPCVRGKVLLCMLSHLRASSCAAPCMPTSSVLLNWLVRGDLA